LSLSIVVDELLRIMIDRRRTLVSCSTDSTNDRIIRHGDSSLACSSSGVTRADTKRPSISLRPLTRLRLESTKITDTGAADLKKPLPESAII